jgi:hypothetical protein
MKTHALSLFLVVCILSLQCGKDEEKENPPPAAKIDLSNYTITDITGAIISNDDTDWWLDDNWTAEEIALFQTPSAEQLANMGKADINIYPAYPNPFATVFDWSFYTTKVTLLQWVITDSLLNVKERNYITSRAGQNTTFRFSPDASKYADQTTYRFYYAFYSQAEGAYARGHGDIRVIK